MRRLSIAAFVLALTAGASSGCGGHGGGDAGQPSGPPTSVDQYVAALQAVVCGGDAASCCAPVGARADGAACRTLVSDSVAIMRNHVATPPAEAVFNADAAAACLDLARSIVAGCGRFLYDLQNPPCGTVLSPPAAGAVCAISADCSQPASGAAWCEAGRCVLHPQAHDGDACKQDEDCRPAGSLECGRDTHTCRARVGLGETCYVSWDCADLGAGCAAHQCIAPGALGEACGTEVSGNRSCRRDLVCKAGVCAAALAAGSSCASTPDDCEDHSLCVLANAANGKQCVWQGLLTVCMPL
jgi:hypothetical protein